MNMLYPLCQGLAIRAKACLIYRALSHWQETRSFSQSLNFSSFDPALAVNIELGLESGIWNLVPRTYELSTGLGHLIISLASTHWMEHGWSWKKARGLWGNTDLGFIEPKLGIKPGPTGSGLCPFQLYLLSNNCRWCLGWKIDLHFLNKIFADFFPHWSAGMSLPCVRSVVVVVVVVVFANVLIVFEQFIILRRKKVVTVFSIPMFDLSSGPRLPS